MLRENKAMLMSGIAANSSVSCNGCRACIMSMYFVTVALLPRPTVNSADIYKCRLGASLFSHQVSHLYNNTTTHPRQFLVSFMH